MTTLPRTIKVRTNKNPGKGIGISRAVAYRNNIFDPACDLEAMIEAYSADTVRRVIKAIERKRASLSADYFEEVVI